MEKQEVRNRELAEIEAKEEKKPSWKFKVWFLIFIFVVAGFVFYQFSPNFFSSQSEGEKNLTLGQLEEKDRGIGDIFTKSPQVGDFAPDFVSEDVDGKKISLSDFRGEKPVLLVFWATWCGFCAKELPDLKAFANEYQNKIQVITIPSGEVEETIRNYIQEKDINFLMVLDENRTIWNQYLVRGTPFHFLISNQGKIITLRPGLASREDLEIMTTMLTEPW